MEEKKLVVGMPCPRRLEIMGTRPLRPFRVYSLIMMLDNERKNNNNNTPTILKTTKDSKKISLHKNRKFLFNTEYNWIGFNENTNS